MLYGYIKLADETQFTYSEPAEDGTVRVVVEQPRDMGFNSAECLLPAYTWSKIDGFSQADIAWLTEFVRNNAPMIMRLSWEKAPVHT